MIRTKIAILDVTRMFGDKVVISGVWKNPATGKLENIRPVLEYRAIETSFVADKGISPMSVIDTYCKKYQLLKPPHTEDYVFDPDKTSVIRTLTGPKAASVFDEISSATLEEAFGDCLVDCKYVPEGGGERSLGCLKATITGFFVSQREDNGKVEIRVRYRTQNDVFMTAPLVDLETHKELVAFLADGGNTEKFRNKLNYKWKSYYPVYIRMGLARGWAKPGKESEEPSEPRCYLQILGLHKTINTKRI